MTSVERPSPLHARVVRPAALDAAAMAAWRAMLAATPQFESPLLTPEFAALVGGVRDDVRVAVFAQGDDVIGVLAHHRRPGGLARPVGAPFSDAHAFLTWPGRPLPWREAFEAAGLRSFRFSQLVDPHGVFADTPQTPLPSYVLSADPAGGEAAWERLRAGSPKRFKNLRRLEHKLERELGPVTLGPDHDPEAIALLLSWKREQFARTGAHDVLHPTWSRALMDAAFARQAGGARGELLALRAGGRLVTAHFGVRGGGVFHPWMAAFDPELSAYSPGLLFMSRLIREPLGLTRYELSAGSDEYKTTFCDGAETVTCGVADLRVAPGARSTSRLRLVQKLRSRLDHIAEVDITLADRVHGVARAMLDARRLARRATTLEGADPR